MKNSHKSSPVVEFYSGKSVFITGCTGFLGTVLLEKLLYACEGIKCIYILLKKKDGKTIEERLAKLLSCQAFQRLRERSPDFAKKIKPIAGNITEKNIGLSESDYTILRDEVSVVFHSAAIVSLDMSLSKAISSNTRATIELLNICKEMKKLAAFVYVSTAYSNCNRLVIDEKVYGLDVCYGKVSEMLEHAKSEELSLHLLDGRPNTYTYSKALSEHIIQKDSGSLPCVIVRPSTILSSVRDPVPGWVSGWNGANGIIYATMHGFLNSWYSDPNKILDVIPVDVTANLIIVSAWAMNAERLEGQTNIKVYNCCSGAQNPLTIGDLMGTSIRHHKTNCNSMTMNRFCVLTKNFYVYYTIFFFLNVIPAVLLDFVRWLTGKKMRFYKMAQKLSRLSVITAYFCLNQFLLIDNNVRSLYNSLDDTDKEIFGFDIATVDWKNYLKDYVNGLNRNAMS